MGTRDTLVDGKRIAVPITWVGVAVVALLGGAFTVTTWAQGAVDEEGAKNRQFCVDRVNAHKESTNNEFGHVSKQMDRIYAELLGIRRAVDKDRK